jgi:hypothetical protein
VIRGTSEPLRPDEAILQLHNFTRCLNPAQAIVDRQALEVVLAYLQATA